MSLYEAIINSAENVSGMLYSGQGPGFCGAINYQFSRPRFPRPDRPVLGTDGANTCWWWMPGTTGAVPRSAPPGPRQSQTDGANPLTECSSNKDGEDRRPQAEHAPAEHARLASPRNAAIDCDFHCCFLLLHLHPTYWCPSSLLRVAISARGDPGHSADYLEQRIIISNS